VLINQRTKNILGNLNKLRQNSIFSAIPNEYNVTTIIAALFLNCNGIGILGMQRYLNLIAHLLGW